MVECSGRHDLSTNFVYELKKVPLNAALVWQKDEVIVISAVETGAQKPRCLICRHEKTDSFHEQKRKVRKLANMTY